MGNEDIILQSSAVAKTWLETCFKDARLQKKAPKNMHTSLHELAGQTPQYRLVERHIDCGILPCGHTLTGLPIAQVQHHLLGNPYQSPFWRQTKGIQSKGEQNGGHNPSSKVFYIIPLIRVHLAWISFFGGGDCGIGCVSLSISPS